MSDISVLKNYEELNLLDINVENIGVYHGKVIPPAYTVREKGQYKFSRFFYVVKGSIIFNKGKEKELVASEGDIIYLPQDITYFSEWDSNFVEGEYISLNFYLKLSPQTELLLSDEIIVFINDSSSKYYAMLKNMHGFFVHGGMNQKLELKSLFFSFLSDLIKKLAKQELKSREKSASIYKGILYIEDNYIEEFSVKDLANMCNVSENTFRRSFKEIKGMSPVKYKNILKLNLAKSMLETGMYTVGEVAEITKFTDIAYFNKSFKKFYGVNPSAFKKF